MTQPPTPRCIVCDAPLPPPGRRGPARRYCSASCRAAASRERRAHTQWSSPRAEAVLAALPEIAVEQPQMGDLDEVALTVLWAWGVVGRMAGHAREAHPKVACRCELVGTALAAVLEQNFPSK
jgi:hypothetical protein